MAVKPRWVAAWGITLLATGCAGPFGKSFKWPEAPVADVHPQRVERAERVVKEFDARRNQALLTAAQTSWRQGDAEGCRDSLDKILERDPNHRGAILLQAEIDLDADKPAEAVAGLRRLLAATPNDADIAYRLGVALAADDSLAEALPYLRAAAAQVPRNREFAAALAEAEAKFAAPGDSKSAAKPATLATADAADSPNTTKSSSDEAASDEKFAAILHDWEQGRETECAAALTSLLMEHPLHIEANILQAESDLSHGRRESALRRMDRLVVHHPENVQVRQACGLVNEAAGDAERAAMFFAEAHALAERGSITVAGHESAAAPQPAAEEPPHLPESLPSQPLNPVETNSGAPDNSATDVIARGEAALRAGRVDEGLQLLRAAAEAAPTDEMVLLAAAVAALKQNQPELSFELATRGTNQFPRTVALHRVRGMAAYRQGRYSDAEKSLRAALNLDNSHALTYFLLGSALNRLGQPEEAERNLREAARRDARYATRT
jgi:predicted Zn-dependent protease